MFVYALRADARMWAGFGGKSEVRLVRIVRQSLAGSLGVE
jgi:hypothetical protein